MFEIEIPEATLCLLDLKKEGAFERLRGETPWDQKSMVMYGRDVQQPRLTAWYGDASYTYSGIKNDPLRWTNFLHEVREEIGALIGHRFNSVLLNYYRDGKDSIGFHSDNEPELGTRPVIASWSLGAPRTLIFKHKAKKYADVHLEQRDGALLLMMGETQDKWQHGINKVKDAGPRINATFRTIY